MKEGMMKKGEEGIMMMRKGEEEIMNERKDDEGKNERMKERKE